MPAFTFAAEIRTCTSCGDEFDADDGGYCDYYSEWTCGDCGPCDCEDCYVQHRDSRIHSYGYRPHFVPKGNAGEVMMGVELEVGDDPTAIADAVNPIDAYEEHLYLKEDGSIEGAEIVTHPMTLAYARQYPFKQMMANLRQAGCRINSNYGLHVHVSRESFRKSERQIPTPDELPRRLSALRRQMRGVRGDGAAMHQMIWLMFIHRNTDQLEKLARRPSNRWAPFTKPQKGELVAKAKGSRRYDRYQAVNVQNNATFELRFFKSTLNYRKFMAAVEFADASVRYTANLTSTDVLRGNALNWERFKKWVQRRNYTHLTAEINRTGG
jgi:hypothetical protein